MAGTIDLGSVIGPQGPRGLTGEDGVQGIQGIQGIQGEQGDQGETGPAGPQGIQGVEGPRGRGVPQGGLAGYFLRKLSNYDFDSNWSPWPLVYSQTEPQSPTEGMIWLKPKE